MDKTAKEHVLIISSGIQKLAYTAAGLAALSLLVWFGVSMNEHVWNYAQGLEFKNSALVVENDNLRAEIDKYNFNSFMVDLTIYHNKKEQTDSTPLVTADGTRIPQAEIYHVGTRRICAISRDLHVNYGGVIDYGDYIYIGTHVRKEKRVKDPDTGKVSIETEMVVGPFTGFWRVSDIMGKAVTWKDAKGIRQSREIVRTIDLLMDYNHENRKFTGVEARLFPDDVFLTNRAWDAKAG